MGAPLLLALVLIVAGVAKRSTPELLVSAARGLRVPPPLHGSVRYLPWVEIALGIALLVLPWSAAAAVASVLTLGLMLVYTALIARALTFDPRPTCGCFGAVGSPIAPETLLRNVVFTALALTAVVWNLRGGTVPAVLIGASVATWLWLGALALALLVGRWVIGGEVSTSGRVVAAERGSDLDHELDYERAPIPALMVHDESTPVSLAELSRERAQLLVWVTCTCQRSHDALSLVASWREQMSVLDIRLISTMSPEKTRATFPDAGPWLFDSGAQALVLLGVQRDPVGLLLGADGLLAGGPVEGLEELSQFGTEILEQVGSTDPA